MRIISLLNTPLPTAMLAKCVGWQFSGCHIINSGRAHVCSQCGVINRTWKLKLLISGVVFGHHGKGRGTTATAAPMVWSCVCVEMVDQHQWFTAPTKPIAFDPPRHRRRRPLSDDGKVMPRFHYYPAMWVGGCSLPTEAIKNLRDHVLIPCRGRLLFLSWTHMSKSHLVIHSHPFLIHSLVGSFVPLGIMPINSGRYIILANKLHGPLFHSLISVSLDDSSFVNATRFSHPSTRTHIVTYPSMRPEPTVPPTDHQLMIMPRQIPLRMGFRTIVPFPEIFTSMWERIKKGFWVKRRVLIQLERYSVEFITLLILTMLLRVLWESKPFIKATI